ncbi:period circadian protein [Drosophila bipectinata]|uniref:period circadian protein n=1 Tax=Drosophila bipectinata TaxID=42026 RepID=UPI0038B35B14
MRVPGEVAGQFTSATERKMTLHPNSPAIIRLLVTLALLSQSLATPQQFFFAQDLLTGSGTGTGAGPVAGTAKGAGTGIGTGTGTGANPLPVNDPSDLSAGLNLTPVSNLIAAAANAVPPAPVTFIRTAMNSGL